MKLAKFAAIALAAATAVAGAQPIRWVPLADHFTATGPRQLVTVGAGAGRFHRLRIEGERGRPLLRSMFVRFADGSSQDIRLDRVLRPGESVVYELDGGARQIAQIVVKTQPDSKSAYSIMAEK